MLAFRRLEGAEVETDFKWNILAAMTAMKSSWIKVNELTIRHCYRKCGFVKTELHDLEEEHDELTYIK